MMAWVDRATYMERLWALEDAQSRLFIDEVQLREASRWQVTAFAHVAGGISASRSLSLRCDLCQDFGHGSSRNQAAIGMASGLGSVLSKKAAMASAGTL